VAVLFALSDEVAVDPAVVDRWRSGSGRAVAHGDADPPEAHRAGATGRAASSADAGDATSTGDAAPREPGRPAAAPHLDELALLLGAPGGALAPELPEPAPLPSTP